MVNKYANPETVLGFAYRSSQSQPTHRSRGRECLNVNISVKLTLTTFNWIWGNLLIHRSTC